MKINKKRPQAKAANKKIKKMVQLENVNDKSRKLSKKPAAFFAKDSIEIGPKKILPAASKVNAVNASKKQEASTPAKITRSSVVALCETCNTSIFGRTKNNQDICQCYQNCHFGLFWQKPVDESKIVTMACYRVADKTYWTKVTNKRGPGKMTLSLPGGKIQFAPPAAK